MFSIGGVSIILWFWLISLIIFGFIAILSFGFIVVEFKNYMLLKLENYKSADSVDESEFEERWNSICNKFVIFVPYVIGFLVLGCWV